MDSIKAIVQSVIEKGKHGPYAVAINDELDGSITFSLESTVWKESDWPESGNVVRLSAINQKRAGWRAKEGRFWSPSDEQLQQRAITAKSNGDVKFPYPTSRQFPFDEVCELIVRKAEARNWNIPGIHFKFDSYSGVRHVSKIWGSDFQIHFCRVQGRLNEHFNDMAGVHSVSIPKMEISVYEDESGPRLHVYIGENWEEDKKWFIGGIKIHSKKDKKPRLYLLYRGGCKKPKSPGMQFVYLNTRPPYLVNDDDSGREYSAEGEECLYYETSKIFKQFTTWLEDNVLKLVL